MSARPWLRAALNPSIILPLLLSSALLAVALSLGDLGAVLGRVMTIPVSVLAFALAMAIGYLAVKGWQLHLLLRHIDLHPGWRRLIFAYSVGELSLTLPLGIFAQNWMLSATARGRPQFGRSSAATVVMLMLETLVVLLLLAVVGIPDWPQVQPIAALFAAGLLAFSYLAFHFGHRATGLPHRAKRDSWRKVLIQFRDLVQGLQRMYRPRLLAVALLATAVYLCALALAFMVVGRAMGLSQLAFLPAATIYAFSLAVALITGGLTSQIGVIEVAGIAAAQAWGYSLTDGLALMLGFRLVWTGSIWLVSLPLVLALWRRV